MTGVDSTGMRGHVIAISDQPGYSYGPEVIGEIRQDCPTDYRGAADYLNRTRIPVVNLHHEYGIFGGEYGSYVLEFSERLERPLVVTLHTILSEPLPDHCRIIQGLANTARALVVMTECGRELLASRYGVDPRLVHVIPHGVPAVRAWNRREIRRRLGLAGREVLCTFGLINPGKGIEFMLHALPGVVTRHPRIIYLVLGQTHPVVKRLYGEAYREHLNQLAVQLGIDAHVRFVDTYLSEAELTDYLLATDVYVTPYLGADQIVSGTLAYAVGLGKAIVSTPYLYAQELLGQRRGLLVPFRDPEALENALNRILDSAHLRYLLQKRALSLGITMTWPRVGARYASLFREVMGRSTVYERIPRFTVGPPATANGLHGNHPTRHLFAAGPGQRVHHGRQRQGLAPADESAGRAN